MPVTSSQLNRVCRDSSTPSRNYYFAFYRTERETDARGLKEKKYMADTDYKLENYIPVVKYYGLNTDKATALGSTLSVAGAATFASTAVFTGAVTANGGLTGTSAITMTNGVIYPIVSPFGTPVAYTGDATLVAADLNKNVTNTGASGTVVLTLPAVTGLTGYILHVEVTAAQIVRLLPVSGTAIALGGSAVVTKYLNIAGVIGNMVDVYCDGTRWLVVNRDGVITKEA